jgi:hypothetical protein
MLAKQKNQRSITASLFRVSCVLVLLLWILAGSSYAQSDSKKALPFFQDYKGVKIGMKADEVRSKLGKAKTEDKDGFMYTFSDYETVQIILDGEQKVRTVSIMYDADYQKPLKFEDVFGKSVEPEKQEGGSIYKLVSYPDSGYWVSYNRMAGDKAMTIVVMQKLP